MLRHFPVCLRLDGTMDVDHTMQVGIGYVCYGYISICDLIFWFQILVVAGGRDSFRGEIFDSNEVLNMGSLTPTWTTGKKLPRPLFGVASINLDNSVVLIGMYYVSICYNIYILQEVSQEKMATTLNVQKFTPSMGPGHKLGHCNTQDAMLQPQHSTTQVPQISLDASRGGMKLLESPVLPYLTLNMLILFSQIALSLQFVKQAI